MVFIDRIRELGANYMENFSLGWKSQPWLSDWNICRLYEIFSSGWDLNIYFQPALKVLAPNKSLIWIFKMAAQIYKLWLKQLLWQSAILLLSLHIQFYVIISLFKLHKAKQNIRVLSYLSRKWNILLKKTNYKKAQNVCRKKDLCEFVLQKELTLGGKSYWCKNFRMNKKDSFELAGLLEPIIRTKGNSPN